MGGGVIEHKNVLFSLQFFAETFRKVRSTRYSCQILMKLQISRQIFEKYSLNFVKIRLVGAEFYADERSDGQADRHDEANSCFSQFCERA